MKTGIIWTEAGGATSSLVCNLLLPPNRVILLHSCHVWLEPGAGQGVLRLLARLVPTEGYIAGTGFDIPLVPSSEVNVWDNSSSSGAPNQGRTYMFDFQKFELANPKPDAAIRVQGIFSGGVQPNLIKMALMYEDNGPLVPEHITVNW